MSALSLQFPKKPNDVVDDLESFVYVIVYMALRFHRHDMSRSLSLSLTPTQLSEENAQNDALASLVHQFFSENWACQEGYRGGGKTKRLFIRGGVAPLTLNSDAKGRPSPLAMLIDRLYELLYEHYRSLDYKELAKYSVTALDNKQENTPAGQGDPEEEEEPVYRDPAALVYGQSTVVPERPPATAKTTSKKTARSAPEKPPSECNPVLNSHSAIITAFDLVYKDENGYRDLRAALKDKYADQFMGL